MNIVKYIINDKNIPILFSKSFFHNEVLNNGKSAGFAIINQDSATSRFKVRCFGESTTLNIKADPNEDKQIIESYLNEAFFNSKKLLTK